ncbi:MAG: DNA-processing protein DprA [Eubacteriales bacterium]
MSLAQEKIIRAVILTIPGIGGRRLRQLVAYFGSAENAWMVPEEEILTNNTSNWIKSFLKKRNKIELLKMKAKLEEKNISLVMPGESEYPILLGECSDCPPLLFYKGSLKKGLEGIAVVGARKATAYGRAASSFLAKEIAHKGYVVVSGLARGIDTAAHKGALEANGVTWAFMAGGLDNIYPPENKDLAGCICKKGAILSEYPPEVYPEQGFFPARNRLISGSSRGVVVVEASQKSGALITVDFALEQGREVFAVPGPIFSEMSVGTHQLLRMGAKIVENADDIVSELIGMPSQVVDNLKKHKNLELNLDEVEDLASEKNYSKEQYGDILQCFSDIPIHIDRLVALCKLPSQDIALGLLKLQLEGKIEQLPGQLYVLARKNWTRR